MSETTGRKPDHDPVYSLRLPPELVAEIDTWAESRGISRSSAIRCFAERALRPGKGWSARLVSAGFATALIACITLTAQNN